MIEQKMKPKCTMIASFSNPQKVLEEAKRIQETYEVEIILPTPEWMDRMKRLMGSTSGKFDDPVKCIFKRIHMETYFRAIREADWIHIFNVKIPNEPTSLPPDDRKWVQVRDYFGFEYYGQNTLMEIGYAHALGKLITSFMEPTEPELRNLVTMQV